MERKYVRVTLSLDFSPSCEVALVQEKHTERFERFEAAPGDGCTDAAGAKACPRPCGPQLREAAAVDPSPGRTRAAAAPARRTARPRVAARSARGSRQRPGEASGAQAARLPAGRALSELVFAGLADRGLGLAAAAHTPPSAAGGRLLAHQPRRPTSVRAQSGSTESQAAGAFCPAHVARPRMLPHARRAEPRPRPPSAQGRGPLLTPPPHQAPVAVRLRHRATPPPEPGRRWRLPFLAGPRRAPRPGCPAGLGVCRQWARARVSACCCWRACPGCCSRARGAPWRPCIPRCARPRTCPGSCASCGCMGRWAGPR